MDTTGKIPESGSCCNSSLWVRMPTEVLERMVAVDVMYYSLPRWPSSGLRYLPREPCRLKTYALVCRRWFNMCAPVLYRQVYLRVASPGEFYDIARHIRMNSDKSSVCQHATHGVIDIGQYLTESLSRLRINRHTDTKLREQWLPSVMQWHYILHRGNAAKMLMIDFLEVNPEVRQTMTELTYRSCEVDFPANISLLLRAVPTVTKVAFDDVVWKDYRHHLFQDPTSVHRMVFDVSGGTSPQRIAKYFAKPQRNHESDSMGPGCFSGLPEGEILAMESIIALWRGSIASGTRFVMRDSPHPRTWVIHIIDYSDNGSRQLEFHVTQNPGVVPTESAWIRWIVFSIRGRQTTSADISRVGLTLRRLADCLRALLHPEKVVLEVAETSKAAALKVAEVASKLGALGDSAFVWSREEACAYAQSFVKDTTVTSADVSLPISDRAAYELLTVVGPIGHVEKIKLLVD